MAKQRRSGTVPDKTDKHPPRTDAAKPSQDMTPVRTAVTVFFLVVAGSIGFKGYLETRVNTKFDNVKIVEKSGLQVPDRFWGSYRPGLYFGMKTRDPHSLVAGMMWYFPKRTGSGAGIRHWCEQSDDLRRYTWTEHDGRNFGIQEIDDGPYRLTTSFVKLPGGDNGGDWTARVTVSRIGRGNDSLRSDEEIALIFYAAIEEKTEGRVGPDPAGDGESFVSGIAGRTTGLGRFKFRLYNQSGDVTSSSYLSTVSPGLHVLKETVADSLRFVKAKKRFLLPGEVLRNPDGTKAEPNFVALQISAGLSAPLDVAFVFESESRVRKETFSGRVYEEQLEKHRRAFDKKFRETFELEKKGITDEDQIHFARAVFSNLVGGIGYFYGASRVRSSHTENTVPYWKAPLYTAVPSRSFFPRGFLWDEGFHGLLIGTWDLDIEFDILEHWFDLMNIEGWIPREQILGREALSKVPEEFVTQDNTNANPPVFFLTLRFLLRNSEERLRKERKLTALDRLFPRLQAWFDWFNVTQVGDLPGTYRWRGRSAETTRELNPKTLTSGFDDYPRASHPNGDERHVDLRCWIALGASVLGEASRLLNRNGKKYDATYAYLTDPDLLDELHWSPERSRYADYGLHTDSVLLRRPPVGSRRHSAGQPVPNPEKVRVVLKEPELRFVDSHFGYVSLFPFLLEMLRPDSPKLEKILMDLKDPELLWTDYGLRSLAKNSPLYMQYNTEHDPPYWRGPIWINVNYLTVKALHHYKTVEGPYRGKAAELYDELRQNIIRNVYKEYKRTGFVWEQYNDKTGQGQGCRPFTGWSSLVVLLMAEKY